MIFLDGKMIEANDALIESLAPGVILGQGVFETMRYEHGGVCFLDLHLARLFNGLMVLDVRLPYSKKRLKQILFQVIEANVFNKARVRLAVWREGHSVKIGIVCQRQEDYACDKYKTYLC